MTVGGGSEAPSPGSGPAGPEIGTEGSKETKFGM